MLDLTASLASALDRTALQERGREDDRSRND